MLYGLAGTINALDVDLYAIQCSNLLGILDLSQRGLGLQHWLAFNIELPGCLFHMREHNNDLSVSLWRLANDLGCDK